MLCHVDLIVICLSFLRYYIYVISHLCGSAVNDFYRRTNEKMDCRNLVILFMVNQWGKQNITYNSKESHCRNLQSHGNSERTSLLLTLVWFYGLPESTAS